MSKTDNKIKAFLLDIEGTTTSISFVKDVLFPYVKENLVQFLNDHWNDCEIQNVIEELKVQNAVDIQEGLCDTPIGDGLASDQLKTAVLENILWQMKLDRKTTALKKLQGIIWAGAYANQEVKGHIFDDVLPALKAWNSTSQKVYIYSSGSVQAQKLLFSYSVAGDLTKYLHGYFDTLVGAKISSDSYRTICKAIELQPSEVVFLTDIPKEATAAKEAGLNVSLVARPGNTSFTVEDEKSFKIIDTFECLH